MLLNSNQLISSKNKDMKIALILFATLFCYVAVGSSTKWQQRQQLKDYDQLLLDDEDEISDLLDIEEFIRYGDYKIKVQNINFMW